MSGPRAYAPHPGTATGVGRAYSTKTRLGALMALRGKTCYKFGAEVNISPRRLTEILAGRVPIETRHVPMICAVLDCDPEDLHD